MSKHGKQGRKQQNFSSDIANGAIDAVKEKFAGIEGFGALSERASAIGESVEGQIHARPFASVGMGVAFGLGLGFLLRRGLFGALIVAGAGLLLKQFAERVDLGTGFAAGNDSDEEFGASSEDDSDESFRSDDASMKSGGERTESSSRS